MTHDVDTPTPIFLFVEERSALRTGFLTLELYLLQVFRRIIQLFVRSGCDFIQFSSPFTLCYFSVQAIMNGLGVGFLLLLHVFPLNTRHPLSCYLLLQCLLFRWREPLPLSLQPPSDETVSAFVSASRFDCSQSNGIPAQRKWSQLQLYPRHRLVDFRLPSDEVSVTWSPQRLILVQRMRFFYVYSLLLFDMVCHDRFQPFSKVFVLGDRKSSN